MSYIDWIDHGKNLDQDWMTKTQVVELFQEDIVIRTYGEILYEDENKILIATERRLDKDIFLPKYRYLGVIHKKLVIGRGK